MTLQNQTQRRTENLVYSYLATQRRVNSIIGTDILRKRTEDLRTAAQKSLRLRIEELGGVTPQFIAEYNTIEHPISLYETIMSATLGDFVGDESGISHEFSPARVAQYLARETAEGIRSQYATKAGLKEVAKFAALGTLGTLSIW